MNSDPKHGDPFAPESVDECIEQLLQKQSEHKHPDTILIHELQSLYQEDANILMRARERLFQSEAQGVIAPKQETKAVKSTVIDYRRHRSMKQQTLQPERANIRRFALVAAIIFATLLVGSMAGFAYFARSAGNYTTITGAPGKTTEQHAGRPVPQNSLPSVYVSSDSSIVRTDAYSGKIIWTYKLPVAAVDAQTIVKTLSDGTGVYIAFMNSTSGKKLTPTIIAVDAQSGKQRWSHQFDVVGKMNDMVLAGSLVYGSVGFNPVRQGMPNTAGVAQNKPSSLVYALNISDGKETSKYSFDGEVDNIAIADGILYASTAHAMSAVNLGNGKQVWSTTTDDQHQVVAGPNIANGVAYTTILNLADSSGNGMQSVLAAFKASNGTKLWQSQPFGRGPFGLTFANNVIYAGSDDGTLYAYDAQQGKRLWSHPTNGTIEDRPFVSTGKVYISEDVSYSSSQKIVAIDASTGKEKWQTALSGGSASIVSASNDTVYVARDGSTDRSSKLYALDAANGKQVWTTPIPGNVKGLVIPPIGNIDNQPIPPTPTPIPPLPTLAPPVTPTVVPTPTSEESVPVPTVAPTPKK